MQWWVPAVQARQPFLSLLAGLDSPGKGIVKYMGEEYTEKKGLNYPPQAQYFPCFSELQSD